MGFIFVIGSLHKKFPKLNFAILVQNRKNKLRKKSFCRNFFHKMSFLRFLKFIHTPRTTKSTCSKFRQVLRVGEYVLIDPAKKQWIQGLLASLGRFEGRWIRLQTPSQNSVASDAISPWWTSPGRKSKIPMHSFRKLMTRESCLLIGRDNFDL